MLQPLLVGKNLLKSLRLSAVDNAPGGGPGRHPEPQEEFSQEVLEKVLSVDGVLSVLGHLLEKSQLLFLVDGRVQISFPTVLEVIPQLLSEFKL